MPPSIDTQWILLWALAGTFNPLFIASSILLFTRYKRTQCFIHRGALVIKIIVLGNFLFMNGALLGCNMLASVTESFSSEWVVSCLLAYGVVFYSFGYAMMSISLLVNQLLARVKLQLNSNSKSVKITFLEKFFLAFYRWMQPRASVANMMPDIPSSVISKPADSVIDFQSSNQSSLPSHSPLSINGPSNREPQSASMSLSRITQEGSSNLTASSTLTSKTSNNFHQQPSSLDRAVKDIKGRISEAALFRLFLCFFAFTTTVIVVSCLWWTHIGVTTQRSSTIGKIIIGAFGVCFNMFLWVMLYAFGKDSLGIKTEIACFATFLTPLVTSYVIVEHASISALEPFREDYGSFTILIPVGYFIWLAGSCLLIYRCESEIRHNSLLRKRKESWEEDLLKILLSKGKFKDLKKSMAEDLCIENALFLEELIRCHQVLSVPFTIGHAASSASGTTKNWLTIRSGVLIEGVDSRSGSMKMAKSNSSAKRHVDKKTEDNLVQELYINFIKPGAVNELNLSNDIRKKVQEQITAGNLSLSILDPVKNEVSIMVYQNNYKNYLKKLKHNKAVSN